jgi:hypothetical protein
MTFWEDGDAYKGEKRKEKKENNKIKAYSDVKCQGSIVTCSSRLKRMEAAQGRAKTQITKLFLFLHLNSVLVPYWYILESNRHFFFLISTDPCRLSQNSSSFCRQGSNDQVRRPMATGNDW